MFFTLYIDECKLVFILDTDNLTTNRNYKLNEHVANLYHKFSLKNYLTSLYWTMKITVAFL